MYKKATITREAKQVLSSETLETVKGKKLNVVKSTHPNEAKAKYSKKDSRQKVIFTAGRDLLQYNIVVRPYILRKYRIEKDVELDVLLYLFPFQYFTSRDFKQLPIAHMSYNLKTLRDLNYIEIVVQHKIGNNGNVYGLTERAKKIVKEYYEYLSGEKTVNPKGYKNPFADKESFKVDEQRQKVLDKLTHQTKTQKKQYRKHFYDF